MATVKDMKIGGHVISFSFSNIKNNVPTEKFDLKLDKVYKQCSLKLNWEEYNDIYTYSLTTSILFSEIPDLQENQLKMSICFNSSDLKYLFILNSTNSIAFSSSKSIVYESTLYNNLYNNANIEVHVEIYCLVENVRKSLLKNMNQLLKEKIHSDLELVADGKIFNVHKNILSIRNEVFCKMIETDMEEKNTGIIKLETWSHIVVEQLLKYIYTDSCDVALCPHQLFKLAHYLGMEELTNMSKQYLLNNININNIIETIKLAAQKEYDLSDLKLVAEKFVESNESNLAKHDGYVKYLTESMNSDNIAFILKFSQKNKIKSLLDEAVNFITFNHEEILEIDDCEKLLISEPSLMFKLLKHSLKVKQSLPLDKDNE